MRWFMLPDEDPRLSLRWRVNWGRVWSVVFAAVLAYAFIAGLLGTGLPASY